MAAPVNFSRWLALEAQHHRLRRLRPWLGRQLGQVPLSHGAIAVHRDQARPVRGEGERSQLGVCETRSVWLKSQPLPARGHIPHFHLAALLDLGDTAERAAVLDYPMVVTCRSQRLAIGAIDQGDE